MLFITLKIDGSTPTLDGMEEVDDHRDDRGEEDARRLPRRGRGKLPAAAHAVVVVPIPPTLSSSSSSSSSSPSSTIIFPNTNITTAASRRWAQQSKKDSGHRVVTYNIRKMNVVNNFGRGNNCDGRKKNKPVVVVAAWERTCRPMALLRIASVLLVILWLLALAAVMITTGGGDGDDDGDVPSSSLSHGPRRVVALRMPEVELAAVVAVEAAGASLAEATMKLVY